MVLMIHEWRQSYSHCHWFELPFAHSLKIVWPLPKMTILYCLGFKYSKLNWEQDIKKQHGTIVSNSELHNDHVLIDENCLSKTVPIPSIIFYILSQVLRKISDSNWDNLYTPFTNTFYKRIEDVNDAIGRSRSELLDIMLPNLKHLQLLLSLLI